MNDKMELVALNRPQLEAAHDQMLAWTDRAIASVDKEQVEEQAAHDTAVRNGWKNVTSRRRIAVLERRKVYYGKIREAIEAGYVIIPNFELTLFAVRTDAAKPSGGTRSGEYNRFPQQPKFLPSGEGRYIDPTPYVHTERDQVPGKQAGTTVERVHQWPTALDEEIEFPIALAKPVLMEQVGQAMKRKLFDEIGVASDSWTQRSGRPDPIIVGRLRNPRKNHPAISFFIGWYFDPSRL